ncbi:MAG: SAM-dependent methyltransferase [Bdellovibrionales bacterium]
MKLTLIATPIGNDDDITLRALNTLKTTKVIVCEELKVTRRRLSKWGIPPQKKELHQLNEHSSPEDVKALTELCETQDVALVTDCGTPSFFDPGFKLVKSCLLKNIEIASLPGVSSMTSLFPFLRTKTERFDVLGFPPRDNDERNHFFKNLKNIDHPILLLDTPYRLKKTFENLQKFTPKHQCVVGINLTCEDERVLYGTPSEVLDQMSDLNKENFICMVYPAKS